MGKIHRMYPGDSISININGDGMQVFSYATVAACISSALISAGEKADDADSEKAGGKKSKKGKK